MVEEYLHSHKILYMVWYIDGWGIPPLWYGWLAIGYMLCFDTHYVSGTWGIPPQGNSPVAHGTGIAMFPPESFESFLGSFEFSSCDSFPMLYPLVMSKLLLNMAIEIVDLPWFTQLHSMVNLSSSLCNSLPGRVYSIFPAYCWLLSISISHCDDLLTSPHHSVSRCLSAGRVERRVYFCPWIVLANIPIWLVVWNMNFMTFQYFPYIGKNHPNWLSYCSEG